MNDSSTHCCKNSRSRREFEVNRIRASLSHVGCRLLRLKTSSLALLVLAVMLIKVGINFTPISDGDIRADLWPAPSGSIGGSSYGMRAIAIGLELEGFRDIAITGLILTALSFCILLILLNSTMTGTARQILIVLLLSSPAVTVLLSYVGRFDVFLIAGSWVVALAPWTRHTYVIGALGISLMLAGNPEQALVAGIVLLLLTFTAPLRNFRGLSYMLIALSAIVTAGTTFWASMIQAPSRLTYWPEYLALSWSNFSNNWPLVIYSGFGLLAFAVVIAILEIDSRDRFFLFIGLVVVPIAVVATTIDQTRVLVGVTTLGLTAMTIALLKNLEIAVPQLLQNKSLLMGALFVFAILLPSFEVDQFGSVREPYAWLNYLRETGITILSSRE